MDSKKIAEFVNSDWEKSILPTLEEYIRVPNCSPQYERDFYTNGLIEKAMAVLVDWVKVQKISGLSMEVLEEKNRTPLIFITVEGTDKTDNTVLMYGHFDKQPPMHGWSEGLGPYTPVIKDGKLYGRGGADDGYSLFAALGAIKALKDQGIPHARCVVMIEACEESGSRDLMHYVDLKSSIIGTPDLVICLDSGCASYDQLWCTSSLRGNMVGELRVKILKEGVHSGSASGCVPSSFRILRTLLDRIEDSSNGLMKVKSSYCEIPEKNAKYAEEMASSLGGKVIESFPFVSGAHPIDTDIKELLLNLSWRPALSTIGVDGIPSMDNAGNVLRPESAVKVSLRLPPIVDPSLVVEEIKQLVEKDVPYGAQATFTMEKGAAGWAAREMEPWLEESLNNASRTYYQDKPARFIGEGGSIPFIGMLQKMFPTTQFVVTGLLGPGSNAHGPNEFLHIQMGKNLTSCMAHVLSDHYQHITNAKKRRV